MPVPFWHYEFMPPAITEAWPPTEAGIVFAANNLLIESRSHCFL